MAVISIKERVRGETALPEATVMCGNNITTEKSIKGQRLIETLTRMGKHPQLSALKCGERNGSDLILLGKGVEF